MFRIEKFKSTRLYNLEVFWTHGYSDRFLLLLKNPVNISRAVALKLWAVGRVKKETWGKETCIQ